MRIFEQIQRDHGVPLAWLIQYIEPDKPNPNVYIERFNRTFARKSSTATYLPV